MATRTDDEFDALFESLVADYMKRDPATATSLGLHEYDHLVPDLSREGTRGTIRLLEVYLEKFRALDESELTGPRPLDYRAVISLLEVTLIYLRDWGLWRMYPAGVETAGRLLFPLVVRKHIPLEHRVAALVSRLKALDKVALASVEAVDEPYALWVELAAKIGRGLFLLVKLAGSVARERPELGEAVGKALEAVEKALKKLADLAGKAEPGFKPIGRELFEKLLESSLIDETPGELKKLGYAEAERYRKLMREAAWEMGAASVEEALGMLSAGRPKSPGEVLELYKQTVGRLREFLAREGVVDLPPYERVAVIETPEFLRPIMPFAACFPPELFGWSATGFFFVTPPASEEMFAHHNACAILNTAVHEAYPGHHTQIAYARLVKDPARKLLTLSAHEAVEGWAHYCEELMLERGVDRSPEYKLKVYHDALWRAVRVYIDVELSIGEVTFEQAVAKLVRDAYIPEEGAVGEVLRYTLSPAYQLRYSYGKLKIKELREEVRRALGPKYSDALFHRLVLEEGALPVKLLASAVLEKARELGAA